uniref:N(6)-L-threonylcarbamoyladenine synthase n=1 Tax=Henneguya salminicola TaxID=69463 RepID=A0A6G3MG88_HENSL
MVIAIGFEGSANKLGIGIIKDNEILSNLRFTFITLPGQGFKPSDTEAHHRNKILELLKNVLQESKLHMTQIDVICFTQGPGMGSPLSTVAFVARMLSLMYNKPLVGVNHCVARTPSKVIFRY